MQHVGPALIGPILVVDRQAAQAAPHGALVADLNQDQRRPRKTPRPQPGFQVGALLIADFEAAPGGHRRQPCHRRDERRWDSGRHDLREPAPLLGGVFAGHQGMVLYVDDVLIRNSRARQQRPRRLVTVAVPGRARTAGPQTSHDAPLVRAEPIRRLAAADAQDLTHTRLPAKQRFAPGTRGHDIDGRLKLRMQNANQRGQQHHVAEGAAAHCQGSRRPHKLSELGKYRRVSIIHRQCLKESA